MPHGDLFDEVGWVIKEMQLPCDLKQALGVIRKFGSFGAHPEKDGLTEVYSLDDDALMTWCLILEALSEIVYVRPAATAAKIGVATAKAFPLRTPAPSSATSS